MQKQVLFYPLIIGGKKVETEKKIASVSPATKEVLGYACSCSKEQADEAIKASYEAFKKWSLTSVEEKSTCIKKTCSTSDREPFHHGCMECP